MRLLIIAAHVLLTLSAQASDTQQTAYVPDTMQFDTSNALRFVSNPLLGLADGGTIEFWVSAGWADAPGYAPVILSNHGEFGGVYEISITGNWQALQIQTGDKLGKVDFDFSDRRMHHVAIIDYGEEMAVFIDGKLVGGVTMSFADLPTTDFWIGASSNNQRGFIGAVAALRIWNIALTPEDVAAYALTDVESKDAPHPDLHALIGLSDFKNANFSVPEIIFIDEKGAVVSILTEQGE